MKGKGVVLKSGLKMIDWGIGVYAGSVGGIFGLFRCRTNGYGLR